MDSVSVQIHVHVKMGTMVQLALKCVIAAASFHALENRAVIPQFAQDTVNVQPKTLANAILVTVEINAKIQTQSVALVKLLPIPMHVLVMVSVLEIIFAPVQKDTMVLIVLPSHALEHLQHPIQCAVHKELAQHRILVNAQLGTVAHSVNQTNQSLVQEYHQLIHPCVLVMEHVLHKINALVHPVTLVQIANILHVLVLLLPIQLMCAAVEDHAQR